MNLPVDYATTSPANRRLVREEYARLQGGKCYFCEEPLNASPPDSVQAKEINWKLFPPNFLKYPVHLQHDHTSGMTEGAVHSYCNAVMWQYEGK
jgi:hypothetical protein